MKKTTFLFVFLTYLPMFLLKFRARELVGYVIVTFFHVFIVFRVVVSVKSMQSRYSLDAELNYASNELSRLEFE